MEVTEFDQVKANEIPEIKYEYLDHTADVQLHSWGSTLKEAFEQVGMSMYGYMTELPSVEVKQCFEIEAKGNDLDNLLYRFLDELLFLFSAEPYLISKKIEITKFDVENFEISCLCYGEPFEIGKHPQGTEVKAITYGSMLIHENKETNKVEIFVIIDI